jgi:hypothetical protein
MDLAPRGYGLFNRHVDYIHYNPVKDGLVKKAIDWPWSSFHRYVKLGFYDRDWGGAEDNLAIHAFSAQDHE